MISAGARTLTAYYAAIDEKLAEVERDPETAFEAERAAYVAGALGLFCYESPADYLRCARLLASKPRAFRTVHRFPS